jgi:hypothetical protein
MTAPCGYDRPHEPHDFITSDPDRIPAYLEWLQNGADLSVYPQQLTRRFCPGMPEPPAPEVTWCFTHGAPLHECYVEARRFGACMPDRSFAAAGRIPEPEHSEHPPCVCPVCARRRAVVCTGRIPYPGNEDSG